MDDLKQSIAMTALNKMMRGTHFNICTVDHVAEMLGVYFRGSEAYRLLAPLHCVDWSDMPADLRERIPGLIRDCLGVEPAFQFKSLAPEPEPIVAAEVVRRPGLLRLLGRS